MKPHRQISVIEIAVILGAIVLVVAIFLPSIASTGHHHRGSRQLKDASQVRAIQTAMILWANDHHDPGPPEEGPPSPDAPAPESPK